MKMVRNKVWASATHTATQDEETRDWVLTETESGEFVARQLGSGNIVGRLGDLKARKVRTLGIIARLQEQLDQAMDKVDDTNELIAQALIDLEVHNAKVQAKRDAKQAQDDDESSGQEDVANDTALATQSKKELLALATEAGVVGRHKMSKEQLIEALG